MTQELNRDYNVIVLDCGVLGEQQLQENFISADLRLLCGSAMPYELARFYRTIERCNSFDVQPLGLFVPVNLKSYMLETIDSNILFGESSHDLFDSYINHKVYHQLLQTQLSIKRI